MARRASNYLVMPGPLGRLGWPQALGGAVAALSLAFTVSVGAQPAGQRAGADAGAPSKGDAGGALSASADAGASSSASGGSDASIAVGAVSSGDAGASTDLSASMPLAPIPTYRPHAPPLPPPTPEQLAAYEQLRQETEAYAGGARDYKDTITTIITLHYEEKKKSILGGLDNEVNIERDELKKAREVAIQRLEAFIAKYSGPNAQKEATPDAMYRLAALYEERAGSDDVPNSDMAVTLKPAIALYKRVIREFPDYRDIAGIYFFLGYALSDARRNDESQQVWRSLVCHNHYAYPVGTDPKDADIDKIVPMPQDRVETGWKEWRSKYTTPDSLKKGPKEETVFDDPYPTDCQQVAQPAGLPGDDPKYMAEIWWRIGDWEFDQFDLAGGVVCGTTRRSRCGTSTEGRVPTRTRCSTRRSRQSSASPSTSTPGPSSRSSGTRRLFGSSCSC